MRRRLAESTSSFPKETEEDLAISSAECPKKSLYGTRDAAQNWERELGGFLEETGLHRETASTCLYTEETRGISASVHGDDVTGKASWEAAVAAPKVHRKVRD